jgi:hypothetical protein
MAPRRSTRGAVTCCVLGALLLGACSSQSADEQQRRRALLMPPDTRAQREARERKTRVFDDEGNLLESDQKVAGFLLPRGLSAPQRSEHQWFFKGEHVRMDALERYVTAHADFVQINRSADGSLAVFLGVRPKGGDPAALPLTMRLVKLKGAYDASALYLVEPMPQRKYLSESEVEAQLKAQKAHAD